MSTIGRQLIERGRPSTKAEKRKNLIVALLLGEFEIRYGKIKDVKYKSNLAKVIFSGVNGNKIGHLDRILKKFPDWLIQKEEIESKKKDIITIKNIPRKIITVNINTLKGELKTQSNNKKVWDQIDWFLEEPKYPMQKRVKPKKIKSDDFLYMEIHRYFLFDKFYEFSKDLCQKSKIKISFKGLFNSYILHLMLSSNALNAEETMSSLLLWKAFSDALKQDPYITFQNLTFLWVNRLRKNRMGPHEEWDKLLLKCNEYFTHLIKNHHYLPVPKTVSTINITDGSIKFLHNLERTKELSWIFE